MQFAAAEMCLNRGLALHKQAQDLSGERWDLELLKKLCELQQGEAEMPDHGVASAGAYMVAWIAEQGSQPTGTFTFAYLC